MQNVTVAVTNRREKSRLVFCQSYNGLVTGWLRDKLPASPDHPRCNLCHSLGILLRIASQLLLRRTLRPASDISRNLLFWNTVVSPYVDEIEHSLFSGSEYLTPFSPFFMPKSSKAEDNLENLNLYPAIVKGFARNSLSFITSSTAKVSWVMLLSLSAVCRPKYQLLTFLSSNPFATSSR